MSIPGGSTDSYGFINLIKEFTLSPYYHKYSTMFD